jgi:hypothetical protein
MNARSMAAADLTLATHARRVAAQAHVRHPHLATAAQKVARACRLEAERLRREARRAEAGE